MDPKTEVFDIKAVFDMISFYRNVYLSKTPQLSDDKTNNNNKNVNYFYYYQILLKIIIIKYSNNNIS